VPSLHELRRDCRGSAQPLLVSVQQSTSGAILLVNNQRLAQLLQALDISRIAHLTAGCLVQAALEQACVVLVGITNTAPTIGVVV